MFHSTRSTGISECEAIAGVTEPEVRNRYVFLLRQHDKLLRSVTDAKGYAIPVLTGDIGVPVVQTDIARTIATILLTPSPNMDAGMFGRELQRYTRRFNSLLVDIKRFG